ncbi:hypothetical protein [Confluentibacter sediminis]|uniref:hypothetical protein n=1 Tax=Confluentibacter sediminis TaxID=2219045 RepID=UPI000DABAAB9|nr:hypothetical protein [Confluentibacter sediminis]
MSKIFNNYLLFLGILLLTSGINLHANSIIEGMGATTNTPSVDTHLNSITYNASRKKSESKFLFEITETQEIENEESSGGHDLLPFTYCYLSYLNAQLFNELSFKLHNVIQRYKNYFDKSTTKLHVRLQVFII